jgi:hypothetical protein
MREFPQVNEPNQPTNQLQKSKYKKQYRLQFISMLLR